MVNFCLIPQWMFKTEKPVAYPSDPDSFTFGYEQGTELRDPSGKEVGDYFARFISWYTKGGFTDENNVYHKSGYHYELPWWGVLNEVDLEHFTTPEQYTLRYDAIVDAIRKVSPTNEIRRSSDGSSITGSRFPSSIFWITKITNREFHWT